MLDTGAHLLAPMVGRLLLLVPAPAAGALTVNPTLVSALARPLFARFGSVGRVDPDGPIAVLAIDQLIEYLVVESLQWFA